MRTQIYIIFVLVSSICLRSQAQQFISQELGFSMLSKKEIIKNGNDSLQDIQLRISRMSNRMIWLQQKIKEEVSLESVIKGQFVEELSALIKVRGDLMLITRQMIRSQNVSCKLILF
jgi:hypothetical protein